MDIHKAATALDNGQYRGDEPTGLFGEMANAGLVAVFGASDDLMEFRGAIYAELGASDTAYLTSEGLLINECDDEDCPHFARLKEQVGHTIDARWCADPEDGEPDWCWTYETDIPHATFRLWDDDSPYCKGIVFSLDDLPLFK